MIWIAIHAMIILEAGIHWFIIDVLGIDPTPDRVGWKNLLTVAVRSLYLMAFLTTGYQFMSEEFIMFFFGTLFSHLLWFPLALNFMRHKPLYHLSDYGIDWLVNKATHGIFVLRLAWLAILSAGFIYGYFNTHLL